MTYSICRLVWNTRCAVTLLMIRALFVSCRLLFRPSPPHPTPPSGLKLAKLSSAVTHRNCDSYRRVCLKHSITSFCCSALLHIQRAHEVLIVGCDRNLPPTYTHALADGVLLEHILMPMNNAYWKRIHTLAHGDKLQRKIQNCQPNRTRMQIGSHKTVPCNGKIGEQQTKALGLSATNSNEMTIICHRIVMYGNWLRATTTLTTQRQAVIWFKNKLEKIHGTFTAQFISMYWKYSKEIQTWRIQLALDKSYNYSHKV